MAKDLIIGGTQGLSVSQLYPLVESIRAVGFQGDVVFLDYGTDQATQQYLTRRGVKLIPSQKIVPNERVHHARFYGMWKYLSECPPNTYDRVIHVDVRDLIFQTNPSEWLDANLGDAEFVVSSELIPHKHEPWNRGYVKTLFTEAVCERLLDNELVMNCGAFAATAEFFARFCLLNYFVSRAHEFADQPASNLILATFIKPYVKTVMGDLNSGWACQCHAQLKPENTWRHSLMPGFVPPIIDDGGWVRNAEGQLVCIVHQYDPSAPQIIEQVRRRYRPTDL